MSMFIPRMNGKFFEKHMFQIAFKKQKIGKFTPISVYKKVRGENSGLICTGMGRYTIIGYQPFMVFTSKNFNNEVRRIAYTEHSIEEDVQIGEGDPLAVLKAVFDSVKISVPSGLPFPCGAIGYLSYDLGLQLYKIESKVIDDLGTPDLCFAFYDKTIVFDHENKEVYFVAFAEDKKLAERLIKEIEIDIQDGLPFGRVFYKGGLPNKPKSNLTPAEYKKKIAKIKSYLKEGETYQVNFSQRFSCSYGGDPLDLYEKLWKVNPAPYSCFIEGDEFIVVSCSPERLFSVNKGVIDARPIKGTVKRGRNAVEDKELIKKLLNSEKDDAELSMIVDLYRNDIGRISKPGSVKVLKHRAIQKCSHVIHTVSIVEGVLKARIGFDEIIEAMFPGGSITGCPKKRTMALINELEDYARGVYCGSAGYISFGGNMDFNILIRTFAYKDGNLYFHGGGGIVADSDVEAEYKETFAKVEAMMKVI